jgi:NAD(P)-dependent dehydrogenase (short-subunit alcohol dehydrogenase family)
MTGATKTYFVSGGNRGIGLHFVQKLSVRPNVQVITTARNPENSPDLQAWIKEHSNVHVIKYDAAVREDAVEVAKQVEKLNDGIDVFIANAAIAENPQSVLDTPDDLWLRHYSINVLGPIYLFRALHSFMTKRDTRQVVFLSTIAASIGAFPGLSISAYGQSKAALNYTVKELSVELANEGFTLISLHPGAVSTDMGNDVVNKFAAKSPEIGEYMRGISITPEVSVTGQLKLIDNLSKEQTGKFYSYTGEELVW